MSMRVSPSASMALNSVVTGLGVAVLAAELLLASSMTVMVMV